MHAEIENPVDIGAVAALEYRAADNSLLQQTGDAIVLAAFSFRQKL